MRQPAVSCISILVATVAVASHCLQSARAHAPTGGVVRASADVPVVRTVGTGIDIVRMPPRPSPLPAAPPAIVAPVQPPEPPGRLLKLPVTIGGLPSDRQKGWLGIVMDSVERPLATALEAPRSHGVLVLETTREAPARRSELSFGDIVVAFNGEPIEHMKDLCQRIVSATPGREVVLEVWRVAGGNFTQTLQRLGDLGNAHVMYRLGKMYATGFGAARDEAKAADWYRRGAAAGSVQAMTELAGALLEGRGVEKNAPEAVQLLRTAADKDHPEAMHRLGILLRDGKATDKNVAEALRFLTKAGNAGNTAAMVEIGQTYDRGLGVGVDAAEAAVWYRRAADLGNPAGVMNLGNLHLQGRGVAQELCLGERHVPQGCRSGRHLRHAQYGLDAGSRHGGAEGPRASSRSRLARLGPAQSILPRADDQKCPQLEPGLPPRAAAKAARCRLVHGSDRRRLWRLPQSLPSRPTSVAARATARARAAPVETRCEWSGGRRLGWARPELQVCDDDQCRHRLSQRHRGLLGVRGLRLQHHRAILGADQRGLFACSGRCVRRIGLLQQCYSDLFRDRRLDDQHDRSATGRQLLLTDELEGADVGLLRSLVARSEMTQRRPPLARLAGSGLGFRRQTARQRAHLVDRLLGRRSRCLQASTRLPLPAMP